MKNWTYKKFMTVMCTAIIMLTGSISYILFTEGLNAAWMFGAIAGAAGTILYLVRTEDVEH